MVRRLWCLAVAVAALAMTPSLSRAQCGLSGGTCSLINNGDGTITDPNTGLMWLQDASFGGVRTWADAMSWADNLEFAGYSDWRLPSGLNPDGTQCNSFPLGFNCTHTEFGTLYFANFIRQFADWDFLHVGDFRAYWTSTQFLQSDVVTGLSECSGTPPCAYTQDFVDGGNNPFPLTRSWGSWAVRSINSSGDNGGGMSSVPEPSTYLLLMSGLAGITPLCRRRQRR